MKKLLLLAGVFAAMLFAVSCNPIEDPEEKNSLLVTAENLAGTWEAFVEHDFAQGYQQKYRIKFDGESYTMWHMHQEPQCIDGVYGSLVCVGDKYSGKWEYSGGKLVLTHSAWSASSFISNMNPLSYTYYSYNVDTMESNPWYESSEWVVSTLDKDEWTVIFLSKTQLKVKINMDTFVLEKKK